MEKAVIIGRDRELAELSHALKEAMGGNGSTILISGEPGIGKTALVDAFKEYAATQGVKILPGAASADSAQPFLVFSKALSGEMAAPLFEEQEYTSFIKIFAINPAGMLMAQASSDEGDMDADIFAGMLSAVQNFISDSLGQGMGDKAGLGRLEYGDMKILIEHGQHLFLTAVFSGNEHTDMKSTVKQALKKIEERHGTLIEKWTGKMSDIAPVQDEITKLAGAKFLVRKDLEGVKLENERLRIADRVLETLAHMSDEKPLAMFLEDLHWADESSLFVLNYLARNNRTNPILLLGTLRPGESDTLEKVMKSMISEEIMEEMVLEKLDVKNTISIINTTLSPNNFPNTLTERLYEQTKGNPLFVTEMLKGMLQDASIVSRDGKYTLVSESYSVPATVEEVVNRRLESLDPDSMAMVEYASCIGHKFDASLAESNRMIKDTGTSLEKLMASGILLRKNGTVEFSHVVFQSVIYSGIGERWKAEHHRSIGEHLEHTYADRPDYMIYDLARHFSRSSEHTKAFEYCYKAGMKAEAAFAAELAVNYYETALKAAPRLRAGQIPAGRLAELLERQGDLYALLGEFAKAMEKYNDSMETFSEREDQARNLRKFAEIQGKKGDYGKGFSALEEAKSLLGNENSPEYGRICMAEAGMRMRRGEYKDAGKLLTCALSVFEKFGQVQLDLSNALRIRGNLHLYEAEFDSARDCYERSIELCRASGNEIGLSSSIMNLGIVYKEKKEFEKSLAYYKKSHEILKKRKDMFAIGNLLHNMGNVHGDMGDNGEALRLFEESLELRKKLGDKFGMESNLAAISGIYYKKGDMAKSLAYLTEAHELSKKLGDVHGQAMTIANLGLVYKSMGNLGKALEYYLASIEIRKKINDKIGLGLSYYNAGNVYLLRGEMDKALASFEKSLQFHLEAGDKDGTIYARYGLAETKARLGECQVAMRLVLEEIEQSRQLIMKPLEAMGLKILGIICRESGEFEKGAKAFESATKMLNEIGDRKQLAELLYEYALLSEKMEDSEKAEARLKNALAEFERMGMKWWADKCREALANL